MKRIISVLAVAALMAAMLVASVMPAFAYAYPYNNGNANNAPGQANAHQGCLDTIAAQRANDVSAGGGKKEGTLAPTNCDHNFTL
jgi:hypothetical protein